MKRLVLSLVLFYSTFVFAAEPQEQFDALFALISDPSEEVFTEVTSILARKKWVSGNHHEYVFVSFPGNPWDDAYDDLNALLPGFHLATITSQEEQDFVNDMLATLDLGYSQWWLGGLQVPLDEPDPAAGWTWVTGETWQYTNWHDIEPNDGGGCLCENHLALENIKWNDEGTAIGLISGYIAESYDPIFYDGFEE